ncbi:hypothetical protein BDW59DRAFT_56170 [Aspergillus cavernicola]|uniref:Uncharacterized protein n=1 Tax=Aspergillus cavernicola TaxID=176166 RepID=A0ABR4IIK4_9EURO
MITEQQAYLSENITCVNDLSVLGNDFSSRSLHMEAVVEDNLQLVFYYRIISPNGRRSIPPASFVSRCLLPIALVKIDSNFSALPKSQWELDLQASTHNFVHGEGNASVPETDLTLRPHKGNLLGQCVALTWNPDCSALVTNDSELEAFLGWYAMEAQEMIMQGKKPPPYFVISG